MTLAVDHPEQSTRHASSAACPNCQEHTLRRLRTAPRPGQTMFVWRLFRCESCGLRWLSGEVWLGQFEKSYIPAAVDEAFRR